MNNPDAYNNGYTANATQPIGQDGPSGGQPQDNRHDDTDGIPDGFSFNWIGAALLAAILLQINADYYFYMVLAAAVLIHEVGHFAMAKAFKCSIKRVQVFFISILTFKPKDTFRDGHLRRRTAWTVGALPFGGFTEFHSNMGLGTPGERYFQDLAPSKKLAVDLGGVMFNLLTFLVLHNTFRLMPPGTAAFCHSLSLLSLVLLVLNIIPVYPLDGGAAMIHLYEWISGKTFPAKTLSVIRWVGLGVIFFFFFIWTDWISMLIDLISPRL